MAHRSYAHDSKELTLLCQGYNAGSAKGSLANVTRLGQAAVDGTEGAKTYTPSRQPKRHGPGAPIRASLGALGGMLYRRCQPLRHAEAPAAVDRLPTERKGARNGKST